MSEEADSSRDFLSYSPERRKVLALSIRVIISSSFTDRLDMLEFLGPAQGLHSISGLSKPWLVRSTVARHISSV
jgi:hypothetical protein